MNSGQITLLADGLRGNITSALDSADLDTAREHLTAAMEKVSVLMQLAQDAAPPYED